MCILAAPALTLPKNSVDGHVDKQAQATERAVSYPGKFWFDKSHWNL